MSYFDWLCMYACPDGYKRSDYRRLLLALYETEFYWTLNHDENRADDGLRLRDQYEDETGELCDETGPCSLFEMFLGLSIRCDNELMYDPDSGNQVSRWFWMMLENLQLDSFVDRNFDDGRFQWIVFHFKRVNQMAPEELKRHAEGEIIFRDTGRLRRDKNGNYTKVVQVKSNKMTEAFVEGRDASSLSSGAIIEDIYADYANKTKALANMARKELYSTGRLVLSPSAKKIYAQERAALMAKLNIAKKNAPLERQAQLIASVKAKARIEAGGIEDRDEIKKIRTQELKRARASVGTKPRNPNAPNSLSIKITDREWEAIQAGAISDTTLFEILKYSDMDSLRQRATPKRQTRGLTAAARSRARALLNRGYTQAEVASELGISVSTLNNALDL